MAKTVSIQTKENTAKIIVDGNEIRNVISYTLKETAERAELTLQIAITGEIEAQLQ